MLRHKMLLAGYFVIFIFKVVFFSRISTSIFFKKKKDNQLKHYIINMLISFDLITDQFVSVEIVKVHTCMYRHILCL